MTAALAQRPLPAVLTFLCCFDLVLAMFPAPSASNPAGPIHSTDWLLGLLVPPVLLGIVATRALADGLTQAGLVSEQIFAGERLPNLNLSRQTQDRPSPDAGE
jgi:hypothetical protein